MIINLSKNIRSKITSTILIKNENDVDVKIVPSMLKNLGNYSNYQIDKIIKLVTNKWIKIELRQK